MRRALSAILFFPRGGSAHAARGLARELPRYGWSVRLVSGSRRDQGTDADARAFYAELDVQTVDYDAASGHRSAGLDPGPSPVQPSYEDRPGAPDRVFASLDDLEFERQARTWAGALDRAGARQADVLHLHHLTPINEAAGRLAPSTPVIGQLHGTELLMLERIAAGPPPSWTHAERWAARMREWARRCHRLLVAPGGLARAARLLDLDGERLVSVPNGFDPELFAPRRPDRASQWRRHLVERPRGWLPGAGPGSVSYREQDLRSLESGVVIVYVGRFTKVKRLPLLIRAFDAARPRFSRPAALVLLGGYPGEWEGEHPADVIRRLGARDVFLAGWHDHTALPSFLAASDLMVFPSVREQFGQALVEAMACGLPVVAARSFGAEGIVEQGRTGWLVTPDSHEALSGALVEAVNDRAERERRGRAARRAVVERYSWPLITRRVAALFEDAARVAGGAVGAFEEAAEG
jgi:glycosyltransferase involved in cell wall biosynthesis